MSNYTKITDFAAKDTLPTGSAGKVIRGSEFETEFDNISTAIATKANINGQTMTNVDIDSGAIDNTPIGANSASTGAFSSLTATTADIDGGTIDGTNIGANSAGTGAFSSLTATTADIDGGTIDGTNIGATTAGTAEFTTLTAGGLVYPTSDGTGNQFLKTDGSGNLSFADVLLDENLLSLTADASGVTANNFVQVNSDGTVTQITGTNPDVSSDVTAPVPLTSSYYGKVGLVHVASANKWIYIGTDNNYYVLDLTGSAPTISSGASIPGSGTVESYHWNSTDSVFVMLRGTDLYAATLSGTTLTFGSATSVSSYTGVTGGSKDIFYDERSNSSLFIWSGYEYTNSGSPLYIDLYDVQDFDAHVLSFSGTTITVNTGNELVADADLPTTSPSPTYFDTVGLYNHQGASTSFLVYVDGNANTYAAITISVSGTTVTAGSENSLSNLNNDTQPFLGAFWDSAQSDFLFLGSGKYWTVGISGGTITTSADASLPDVTLYQETGYWAYDSSSSRYVRLQYYGSGGAKLTRVNYSWDGTDLDIANSQYDLIDYTYNVYAVVYDATGDNLFVIAKEYGTSNYKGFFYNAVGSTNLASADTKSLGYATNTATSGQTVNVKFGYALQSGFTGLTPASKYYLDNTGQPSLTSTNPVVTCGSAITSTVMMLARPNSNLE